MFATCVVGCSQPPRGTLWYTLPSAHDLMTLDVASDASKVVDTNGAFLNLTPDPVARQLAYTNGDESAVFVADEAGHVTLLEPDAGTTRTRPTWHRGGWLTYLIPNDTVTVQPPGPTRLLGTPVQVPAFSSDGALLAYSTSNGDVHLEHSDGSDAHVLAPNITDQPVAFTPDDRELLVRTTTRLLAISIDDGTMRDLGPGGFYFSYPGDLTVTAYGDHVLVADSTGISILSLADGTRSFVASVPPNAYWLAAALAPDDVVIYALSINTSTTDAVILSTTVYACVAGTVMPMLAVDGGPCQITLSPRAKYAALDCGATYAVQLDTLARPFSVGGRLLGFEHDDEAVYVLAGTDPAIFRMSLPDGARERLTTAGTAVYLP
jgi:hypothetical protein